MTRAIPILCLVAASCLSGIASAARAQGTGSGNVLPRLEGGTLAGVQARRQELFEKMMGDPADLDAAFEYAALSSQAGDLESAVSTLERMLIFAPDVPRLQLELGVLYFRLGSYQLAEDYLRSAIDVPHVPPSVVAKVEPYLAAIRQRTAVDRIEGRIAAGMRYQSNANGGAQNDVVALNGLNFVLSDEATAEPDANVFMSSTFRYSRDLPSQGDRFDVELVTYGAFYSEHDEINTGLAELTFGPVVSLDRFGLEETDLGIYGILGGVVLKDDPYRVSAGVGLRLEKALTRDTRGQLQVEYRYQDYRDSSLRPTASERTGDNWRISGSIRHQVTNRLSIFAGAEGELHETEHAYKSSSEVGATVGGTYLLDPPIGDRSRPWAVSLAFGMLDRSYDAPDTFISTQSQHDIETFVQGTLTIPLREEWAMQAVLSYRDVSSNYDVYTFDNIGASLAIMKSF